MVICLNLHELWGQGGTEGSSVSPRGHKCRPFPPTTSWEISVAPELRVAGAWSWTHVDEVVGIGVLLSGKVVQVGQVLVLGDKESRACTREAGACWGSLVRVEVCPSCTGRSESTLLSLCQGLLLGQPTGTPPNP